LAERVLMEAAIAPNAVRYQVLANVAVLAASIVGVVLLPIVVPVVYWYYTRFYRNLRVILTSRDLKVHRGILNREEKTIPLEKITDLAVFQGPIMRRMGLKGIKVETAGQSSGPGALVNIVGVAQTDEFRDAVLQQRDRVTERDAVMEATTAPALPGIAAGTDQALLTAVMEIRDTLRRIEVALRERVGSLPPRP
jgi:putative membrane protein